ncbi:uncharacterized protein KY384_003138 [Bacidia gigantensis]|uniref:uncharacterized protein n=1 Tax=Bacidia gigantensis TaxID=2732470 RepID=UPI001D049E91|nr:uncharacterized protein KY384_003138 [Bacidia gigantensis]KAG8531509.1 hypothetical protein KY384_003138 [Bacidia gigantensis]
MADYSLYLVTDSTPTILGDKDLAHVVEEALKGGVTIVQYRDKKIETADLVRIAKKLHVITRKYSVPLLINDRIDVALAVQAEGVHIGQEDMDLTTARKLLGSEAIIGVTASSTSEALNAADGGASYIGIGTVYATPTKTDTKSIIGTAGVRNILQALAGARYSIPTVAIGSLNLSNVQRVLYQSASPHKSLSGVAVVSAIMASADPRAAASELRQAVSSAPTTLSPNALKNTDLENILKQVPGIIRRLTEASPLCHNMTNLVVQNFAANVAICIGASPIMSNNGQEAKDLAKLGDALVINMGTVTPEGLANYIQAINAYNEIGGPVLFDPVGGGATGPRRNAIKTLLSAGYFDVIKGNENEILAVLGEGLVQQKGVDSSGSTSNTAAKAKTVQRLAQRERNVVLMTGETDLLSDGDRTYAIQNGDLLLGSITGSGCTLGTTIASFLAVERGDKLLAALAAILMFEIAAELASQRPEVRGPGTFVPAFLDKLYAIAKEETTGWLSKAKVKEIDTS